MFHEVQEKGVKIAFTITTMVIGSGVGVWLFLCLLLGDFGVTSVMHSKQSPEGKYVAEIIDYDEGALGGSTTVEVRRTEAVSFFIGRISKNPVILCHRGWGLWDEIDFEWVLVDDGSGDDTFAQAHERQPIAYHGGVVQQSREYFRGHANILKRGFYAQSLVYVLQCVRVGHGKNLAADYVQAIPQSLGSNPIGGIFCVFRDDIRCHGFIEHGYDLIRAVRNIIPERDGRIPADRPVFPDGQ